MNNLFLFAFKDKGVHSSDPWDISQKLQWISTLIDWSNWSSHSLMILYLTQDDDVEEIDAEHVTATAEDDSGIDDSDLDESKIGTLSSSDMNLDMQ